jgi:hypothetical protein
MGIFTDEYGDLRFGTTVIGLATLASAAIIGGCPILNSWHYSEGDRVGMVNKISKKGLIWETYEGEMVLEGIVSDGKASGANTWDFAVDNYLPVSKRDELKKKVEDSMNAQQKVKIHYVQQASTYPWRSGSNALIQTIEPISTPGKSSEKTQGDLEKKADDYSVNQNSNGTELTLDGKHYLFRHDEKGKLKVIELKEIQ